MDEHRQSTKPIGRPRIGLDLHVADGIYQGSRTHCLELFSRVVAATPECDFIIFAAHPHNLLNFSSNFASSNVTRVSMPHAASAKRLLWQLPHLAKQYRVDLLHTQYIAPPFSSCPTVVTVHDILFESHPQYFDKLFVLRSHLLVRQSVRKSTEVFTVSDFSRNQISEIFGITSNKIHTILNGVDRGRFYTGQHGKLQVESLGLKSGQYFLTVGRLEPRKNHANLLRAWAMLSQPRPTLVIVGQRHFGYDEAIGLMSALQLEEDVLILENISDEQLPALFRNAKAFVYCSMAEGFGMPVLEAMSSGIPVISSATTALTEICGNAAILVRPDSIAEITAAIRKLHEDANTREELIHRGLLRVSDFSWDTSAALVRRVYLRHFALPVDNEQVHCSNFIDLLHRSSTGI